MHDVMIEAFLLLGVASLLGERLPADYAFRSLYCPAPALRCR
jgi:hypothetical protein